MHIQRRENYEPAIDDITIHIKQNYRTTTKKMILNMWNCVRRGPANEWITEQVNKNNNKQINKKI